MKAIHYLSSEDIIFIFCAILKVLYLTIKIYMKKKLIIFIIFIVLTIVVLAFVARFRSLNLTEEEVFFAPIQLVGSKSEHLRNERNAFKVKEVEKMARNYFELYKTFFSSGLYPISSDFQHLGEGAYTCINAQGSFAERCDEGQFGSFLQYSTYNLKYRSIDGLSYVIEIPVETTEEYPYEKLYLTPDGVSNNLNIR